MSELPPNFHSRIGHMGGLANAKSPNRITPFSDPDKAAEAGRRSKRGPDKQPRKPRQPRTMTDIIRVTKEN